MASNLSKHSGTLAAKASPGDRRYAAVKSCATIVTDAAANPPNRSPALDMLIDLDHRLSGLPDKSMAAQPALPRERWSARRTLAFVIVTNSLAWLAIIWMVNTLIG